MLIFQILSNIEISIKTRIAYEHGLKYGPIGYLDINNFSKIASNISYYNITYHHEFLEEMDKEKKRSKEEFVIHHKLKYGNDLPLWVAVEILSFERISKLYKMLINADKKLISNYYNILPFNLESILHSLSVLRNICGHHNKLYARNLPIPIKIEKGHKYLNASPNQLFSNFLAMKDLYLHDKDSWNNYISQLDLLFQSIDNINFDLINFPNNWVDILKNN